jgi:hypothetical protein
VCYPNLEYPNIGYTNDGSRSGAVMTHRVPILPRPGISRAVLRRGQRVDRYRLCGSVVRATIQDLIDQMHRLADAR